MSEPKIKLFGIARMSDKAVLASECVEKSREQEYKEEIRPLLGKISEVGLQPDERQKVKSVNGAWFVTCDKRKIFYLVLADINYPEKQAYDFIYEVIKEINNLKDYHTESESTVQHHTKRYLPKLLMKYNDLRSLDSISRAQENATKAQNVMKENILKAMENKEKFEDLELRTDEFRGLARDFYDKSAELQRKTAQRNRRLMIYIISGISCLVFFFIVTKIF